MKRNPIYLSPLIVILIFWLRAPFNTLIARAQAEQNLGLKLVGTAVGDDPSRNFAIIENQSTGNQSAYREGDRVGDLLIKKILSGSVVIGTKLGDQMLSIGYGGSVGSIEPSPQMAQLTRKEVDATLPDYMQLMQEIRVRPHLEAGRPGGFLIYNIEPDSIFAKMGLENGDVIKAVNGRSVGTTQQAIEFYDALKTRATVSLQIQRDESTQELHFAIQ
jgi:general secretion pathway protein C